MSTTFVHSVKPRVQVDRTHDSICVEFRGGHGDIPDDVNLFSDLSNAPKLADAMERAAAEIRRLVEQKEAAE